MRAESRNNNEVANDQSASGPRTVEAISWGDRARVRNRRQQLPKFRAEVQTPTTATELEGLAEQAARDLYNPTMQARGLHLKTIQQDLAEQAAEGGRGIGQGKHSYEAPAKSLGDFSGMRATGLGDVPLLGRILGLIRVNPRAAQVIATPQRVERGSFAVQVTGTSPATYNGPYNAAGKPTYPNQPNSPYWTQARKLTRDVDLVDVQTPGVMSAEERASIDPFTASLLRGADGVQMSPQQILKLHDLLQAGQHVCLKSGPNGAAWTNRVMGGVGEMLKADAARIGGVNFVVKLFQLGGVIASALGLAAAAGTWAYGVSKINPSNAKIAPFATQAANPYAAPASNDPAAAFGVQPQNHIPQQAYDAPTPYQPFGAVSQNFGNLNTPAAPSPIGAMPTAPTPTRATEPAYDYYRWTRINQ